MMQQFTQMAGYYIQDENQYAHKGVQDMLK